MTDNKVEAQLLEERSMFLVACEAVSVRTPEEYEDVAQMLLHGKALVKEIKAYFEGLKKPAHDAWKRIVAREKEEIAKIQPGLDALNAAMDTYDAEQLRLRLEEEARQRRAEQERRLEAAARLEAAGMKSSAEAIVEEIMDQDQVVPVDIETEAQKVPGMAVVKTWDFEVVEPMDIVLDFLEPDLVAIRKVVRVHGQGAVEIVGPGIRVFEKTTRRSTGR